MSKKSSTFAANFHISGLVHNSKTFNTMAKQSGLHQLRGKVGEHSYYRQTGVASGLVRSINQAMSNRVKTGDEYANTRLNNAEFGQACMLAGDLGKFVSPKFRPMVLPFSQAKIAKDILEIIKADPTSPVHWGFRGLTANDWSEVVKALSGTAKLSFDTYVSNIEGLTATVDGDNAEWEAEYVFQSGMWEYLQSIGADSLQVKLIAVQSIYARPVYPSSEKAEIRSRVMYTQTSNFTSADNSASFSETIPVPNVPVGSTLYRSLVAIFMPIRTIGTTKHILQEYCTFRADEVVEA